MAYAARRRVRTRASGSPICGRTWRKIGGVKVTQITHQATASATKPAYIERTWDETHPGPPYKIGGPFTSIDVSTPWTEVGKTYELTGTLLGQTWGYSGGFIPLESAFGPNVIAGSNLSGIGESGLYGESYLSAEPYGARAYNQARPKLAQASADVFLGELRDFPRMVKTTAQGLKDIYQSMGGNMKTQVMSPKRISDHYLNHVFGWAPFIRDLNKLFDVYQNTDKYLQQVIRDNGRWVRRYRVVEASNNIILHPRIYSPLVFPAIDGITSGNRVVDGISCKGTTDITTQSISRVWFEGSFKYYVPAFDRGNEDRHKAFNKVMQYVTLYGLRVSPATVWKLTPWSWLVDWATNAGDVLDNLVATAYDQLVSRYAFVMKTTEQLNSSTVQVFARDGQVTMDTWIQNLNAKDRRIATPFGFAVDMSTLSTYQLSILAALGLSRVAS